MCAIPSAELLKECSKHIEANMTKIVSNRLQAQSLTKLRDTLLPKLISGELRISEAEQLIEKALA